MRAAEWDTEVRADRAVFAELASWWNRRPGPQSTPFLCSEWFELWSDSLLTRGAELEIVIWTKAGEPVAALPMARSGWRRASLANSHSDVFDIVADPDPELPAVVRHWIARRPVVRFFRLDGSSPLLPVAPDQHWHVDRHSQAPSVDLSQGMDEVDAGLSRNLTKGLRRLERRLAEVGEIVYLDDAGQHLPDAFEQCLRLEASGWKGEAGTAILSRPETTRFYRQLAELGRDRGWLRLCALLVAERLVAFEMDLDYGGRRFSLKAGFDQSLRQQSPGKILQWRVLEAAASAGLSSYEFGGEAEDWKLEWTKESRPRLNVLHFGSRGPSQLLGAGLRAVARRR